MLHIGLNHATLLRHAGVRMHYLGDHAKHLIILGFIHFHTTHPFSRNVNWPEPIEPTVWRGDSVL